MMPQMDPGDVRHERQDPGYGRYEGVGQQPYGTPPPGVSYDDDFADSVAQRLAQRMGTGQGPTGRVYTRGSAAPTQGSRLALAIVSVCVLIPLAAIIFGVLNATGIVAFAVACIAIVLVNAVFNNPSLFK